MVLRITTWNVNGIRNPFGYQPWRDKRTFDGMFDILEADIVIMQELKIQRKDLRDDMVLVPGWDCYFSLPKHKKGYSGVGIYTRNSKCAPIRAEEGILGVLCPPGSSVPYCNLPSEEHIGGYLDEVQLEEVGVDAAALDAEGRCMVLEFPAFVLLGIYSPANSSGTRDDFRYGFINALDIRVRNLVAAGKRVVVTGDLNVSREKLDTANAEETMKKEGITHDDYVSTPNRRIFNQLLEGGLVVGDRDMGRENPVLWDICRGFHPTRQRMYTHWEQKINARPGNFGSRIDFVLCSLDMKPWFCESNIQEGLMGSDHCPVYAVIKDRIELDGKEVNIEDVMASSGTFKGGKRVREWSLKDVPAVSAKLMPEFDKRRSIKDMFGKGLAVKSTESSDLVQLDRNETAANVAEQEMPNPTGAEGLAKESQENSTAAVQTPPPSNLDIASTISSTNSTEKRRPSTDTTSSRPPKRGKSSSTTTSNAGPPKGQQSLKGFFTSQSSPKGVKSNEPEMDAKHDSVVAENAVVDNEEPVPIANASLPSEKKFALETRGNDNNSRSTESQVEGITPFDEGEEVFDPIVAKESWSKLFRKPKVPQCEGHGEPCQLMKTKKPGVNCGREFWMCMRPLGPSGTKERNSQWRCPTFIWSSEWNGNSQSNT